MYIPIKDRILLKYIKKEIRRHRHDESRAILVCLTKEYQHLKKYEYEMATLWATFSVSNPPYNRLYGHTGYIDLELLNDRLTLWQRIKNHIL